MSKDYLNIIDNTAEEKKHEVVLDFIRQEYNSFFRQLRNERPVLKTPVATIVSKFDDVSIVLQQPKIFTLSLYSKRMTPPGGDPAESYLMAHDDNAKHTRDKSIMLSVLDRDDISGVRNFVAEQCNKILKSETNRSINLVNEYSRKIPILLSKEYFGLDFVSEDKIREWSYWTHYNAFYNYDFNLYTEEQIANVVEKSNQCIEEITKYLIKLFLVKYLRHIFVVLPFGRLFKIKNTIVERIVAACFSSDIDFTVIVKATNVPGLFNGAVETTSSAVIKAIHQISSDQQLLNQARSLANDENTEGFDAMIWEALRFTPFTPFLFRVLSQDYTLAPGTPRETLLKKGEVVFVPFGSAMQDSGVYDQPEKFKTGRPTFHYNMSLGFGPHDCLGKHVAAAMVPEMCRQFFLADVKNTPNSVDIDFNPSPFPEQYNVELGS